jgi:hypothetical protein
MKIKAKIKFKYISDEYASIAFNSLEPDNLGFIKSKYKDEYLTCGISGDSISRVLATADDLIFCEMMVERISELIRT